MAIFTYLVLKCTNYPDGNGFVIQNENASFEEIDQCNK